MKNRPNWQLWSTVGAPLLVAAIGASFPDVRAWVAGELKRELLLPAWVLAIVIPACIASGGAAVYLLLRNSLEVGKMDRLTNTYRADGIDAFLARQIGEAARTGSTFGVLLFDIDNFKRINDDYSHEIGNQTLAEVVDLIRPRKKGEAIFRYGGDEFLVVTSLKVDERACWGYANRTVRDVSGYDFLGDTRSHERIRLTGSCGCLVAGGNHTVAGIRTNLVAALKAAKQPSPSNQTGKNAAYLFVPGRDGNMA